MIGRDLLRLAAAERGDLLALLQELTPDHWAMPSLCADWSVRDVAVHVASYDELSPFETGWMLARAGFRLSKANPLALARYQELDPIGAVELLGRCLWPRGLTTAFGGAIALTDATIHHQDIRRAVGMPRRIPAERLTPVLEFSLKAPPLPSRRNHRGLRLVATDLDWSSGKGLTVTGPGEALLMSVAGRAQALTELRGPGLPALRDRIGRPA